MSRIIDHIVYCVPNLEEAIQNLYTRLGVRAMIGGQHTKQGTKNALINLSKNRYLEILAIDQTLSKIKRPRWMGIDLIRTPKITRWSLKSTCINTDGIALSHYNSLMGNIQKGSRKMQNGKTLSWQMTMPLANPEVEVVPFITDWSKSESHPADNLAHPCELLELRLKHPKSDQILNLFEQMNISQDVKISHKASIEIVLKCPNGIVQL